MRPLLLDVRLRQLFGGVRVLGKGTAPAWRSRLAQLCRPTTSSRNHLATSPRLLPELRMLFVLPRFECAFKVNACSVHRETVVHERIDVGLLCCVPDYTRAPSTAKLSIVPSYSVNADFVLAH